MMACIQYDTQLIKNLAEKCRFFRRAQIWPLREEFDWEGWLDNFANDDEKYLAGLILNNFLYFSKKMVDKMFYDSVGQVVSALERKLTISDEDFYKKNILYTYIPGEEPNPCDSGYEFVKRARDILNVPEANLCDFEDLPKRIRTAREDGISAVIFCDDFVGSGSQCVTALKGIDARLGMSLYDYAKGERFEMAYAPLIANQNGLCRINAETAGLMCKPIYVLGKEYNLFEPSCLCWGGDEGIFKAGCQMILEKSAELGIPDDGRFTVSARGFGNQGFFIAFDHGIPDCDPAMFYFSDKGWTPLKKKNYDRTYIA